MSDKHYTVNIESIVKNLESLFENELAEMKVVRSDEHIEMCKILFSHNIRYMRVFLGFLSKESPYEQKEFAGLLTVSTAGLRRWENAEVIPNKAGLKNVVTLCNQLLQLPTPITAAHLLYRNLVTEIPLLRLGSHSAEFQNLPYKEKRQFSSFMTNNMDLMISHFMEREQQSRFNFQTLMEKVNIPIALIKIGDNLPSFVNQALCELVGVPREKIWEIPIMDFLHPDDRQLVQQDIEPAKRGEISEAHHLIRILHSSGKFKIVNSHNRVIVTDGEKYSLSTFQDITEQVDAENAIKESGERYRLLFTSMFTAFALHEVITDKDGKPINYRFLDINPAFEKMTGLKAKNIVGKTVLDILPNTEPYWIETFGNVALTGKPDSLTEYAGEFGKYYEVHGYSPKKGQFAVTFMDVTERVMALNKKDT